MALLNVPYELWRSINARNISRRWKYCACCCTCSDVIKKEIKNVHWFKHFAMAKTKTTTLTTTGKWTETGDTRQQHRVLGSSVRSTVILHWVCNVALQQLVEWRWCYRWRAHQNSHSALSSSLLSSTYRIGWLDILQCEKLSSFISAPSDLEMLFGSAAMYLLSMPANSLLMWEKIIEKMTSLSVHHVDGRDSHPFVLLYCTLHAFVSYRSSVLTCYHSEFPHCRESWHLMTALHLKAVDLLDHDQWTC